MTIKAAENEGTRDEELNQFSRRSRECYFKYLYVLSADVSTAFVNAVETTRETKEVFSEKALAEAQNKFYNACRDDLHLYTISKEIGKAFDPLKFQNIFGKKDEK